jgi:hypothetical protein
MTHDPNEVLITYLGAGPSGGCSPVAQEERLNAAYPHDARAVRAAIEKYLRFPDYPPDEWSTGDLAEAQRIYEQRLSAAFPELNARAINALACRWSYGWR